jgi:hypothetical protein
MMKKIITENERLQLLGLLTLARQHRVIINLSEKAMEEILKEDFNNLDWLSDAIWDDNTTIDEVLEHMDIKVKNETHKN